MRIIFSWHKIKNLCYVSNLKTGIFTLDFLFLFVHLGRSHTIPLCSDAICDVNFIVTLKNYEKFPRMHKKVPVGNKNEASSQISQFVFILFIKGINCAFLPLNSHFRYAKDDSDIDNSGNEDSDDSAATEEPQHPRTKKPINKGRWSKEEVGSFCILKFLIAFEFIR